MNVFFAEVREEDGRPKESEELVAKIATVLAQLDFSDEVYVTMIDLLASRVSLTMQSDRDPTRIAEMIIRYPSGLDGLFLMISKVKPGTRVRILTDVLTMLKNNEKNQVTLHHLGYSNVDHVLSEFSDARGDGVSGSASS